MAQTNFRDKIIFEGEVTLKTVTTASGLSATPTDAEFDTLLGAPATVGAGACYVVIDTGNSKTYFVTATSSAWYYQALTLAA